LVKFVCYIYGVKISTPPAVTGSH